MASWNRCTLYQAENSISMATVSSHFKKWMNKKHSSHSMFLVSSVVSCLSIHPTLYSQDRKMMLFS